MLRSEILTTASKLFHERGYVATSIRELADEVGISSSTMYHHFKNKQDVLYAIVLRFMADFNAAIVPVLRDRNRPPAERLAEAARLHIEISDDRRPELLTGNPFRNALGPEQLREVVVLTLIYHRAVRDTIAEGCADGSFATEDVTFATTAVLDMLNGVRDWFDHEGSLSRKEVVAHYQDLITKLLTPAGS